MCLLALTYLQISIVSVAFIACLSKLYLHISKENPVSFQAKVPDLARKKRAGAVEAETASLLEDSLGTNTDVVTAMPNF